jgi:hypothetical protein
MGTDPHPQAALIYSNPYDVDLQLRARFGLSRDPFVKAVRAGDLERRMTTGDDAEGAAGYYLWTRTLRELRAETRTEAGYHPGKHLLIPATLNNDESIAIAVSSGDNRTGRFGLDPSTANVKGAATERAVAGNKRKLPFGRGADEPVDFWYLLVDATNGELWAEVAQPRDYDHTGHVSGWYIRILLGLIAPDGGGARRRTDLAPAASPAIIVPVTRRSA